MSKEPAKSLRVVVFTDVDARVLPAMNQILNANGHKLVGVVTGPGPKSRRSETYVEIVRAAPPGVDVIVTTHMKRLAAMLRPLNADLFWVLGFMRILPDDVINMPRLGTINTHGGILPGQRGPNPPGWCFRDDVGEMGWTVHRMTSVLDGGPMLAQAVISYGDDDDFESIMPRWTGLIPKVIQQALPRVVNNEPGDPQDESQARYVGFFEPEWRQIDWSQPARSIHNQVRSWYGVRGVPRGAFGQVNGEQRLIIKTQLVADRSKTSAPPGTVLDNESESMLVQCGDGPLRILRWEDVNG